MKSCARDRKNKFKLRMGSWKVFPRLINESRVGKSLTSSDAANVFRHQGSQTKCPKKRRCGVSSHTVEPPHKSRGVRKARLAVQGRECHLSGFRGTMGWSARALTWCQNHWLRSTKDALWTGNDLLNVKRNERSSPSALFTIKPSSRFGSKSVQDVLKLFSNTLQRLRDGTLGIRGYRKS
ncbi:hypothetical protein AVEN_29895-1 [Araneus ventricosus]|uniref:Uncharacterized protein n=1 Tax=Araneus ventricosus TaxID=182803 RepID=A0A4Y2JQM5_ARAVE|nr:hypothetical protein AVEN_29895-1 [Araneus ventricosus]